MFKLNLVQIQVHSIPFIRNQLLLNYRGKFDYRYARLSIGPEGVKIPLQIKNPLLVCYYEGIKNHNGLIVVVKRIDGLVHGPGKSKHDIVREFYVPILKESVLYKRAVGFFSSTALIELSKGISGLIRNGGKIKLIVSPLLSEEDIAAIQRGYDARKVIENSLLREFHEPRDAPEMERLNWLASLVANGTLEIKVAFTPPQNITGMYHEKIGLLYDTAGNEIVGFVTAQNIQRFISHSNSPHEIS